MATAFRQAGIPDQLVKAAKDLSRKVDRLKFSPPVAYIYNPLNYAFAPHEQYLRRYGATKKKIIFIGMNPGPFGMAQTGVPFGEVSLVRDWLGIEAKVGHPAKEHPKRPITGFACTRSEVSGQRLWGTFREQFGTPAAFFKRHFVANYCPLIFMEESGRNLTPDKIKAAEQQALFAACDEHLRTIVGILEPEWVVGVGQFAEKRAAEALGTETKVMRILHPSPASPLANRNWSGTATSELRSAGIW